MTKTLMVSSPKIRAKQIEKYFLKGDDYINRHNRKFDDKWENGDGDAVAAEFRKLYYGDEILRHYCQRSSFFGLAMIGEGRNGYLTESR